MDALANLPFSNLNRPEYPPMSWSRFKKHLYQNPDLGLSVDISRIPFPEGFLATMEKPMQGCCMGTS